MPSALPRVPSPSRRFASINDTATYVDVSTKTIRRYVAEGRISAYRVGPTLLRIDLDEVDAVLLQRIPTAMDS